MQQELRADTLVEVVDEALRHRYRATKPPRDATARYDLDTLTGCCFSVAIIVE